jgi:hypothetical protein
MEFIEKILSLQNDELLVRIALDKFNNLEERKKFIKKYSKFNFKKLKISKNKMYKSYQKRIQKMKK